MRTAHFAWISLLFLIFSCPAVLAGWDSDKGCMSCHEGIERFSDGPVMSTLSCTQCHFGDGAATEQEAAHKGMHANPSDLRVVDKTCGTCHFQQMTNVKTSIHATMAGMISGTRYDFGAQDRQSRYATYAVSGGKPGKDPKEAVESLEQIPGYDPSKPEGPDNSIGDDYLRNQCLRCHLWSDGHQRDGDYRGSGCAACHVVYSDAGLYEGGDKAIKKDQKDRPRQHKLTSKIPEYQCIHCHNRGGRTGVSFIGTMESDAYGTPWKPDGNKQGKLHGKYYNHMQGDIHYERGMTCIDCHTKKDLHGDGYIYTKKEHAVEVRCDTCHGGVDSPPTLITAHGNKMTNIEKRGDKYILIGKMDGKEHEIPLLDSKKLSKEGKTAMVDVAKHMEKLECYACHAEWAPQCYGCHAKQDVAKPNGDWLNPNEGLADLSKAGRKENRQKTAYSWAESRSYLRWETPTLGINHKGKVSPFITGCQAIITQMDGDKNLLNNKVYETVDGTSGFAHNPIQPHTISARSRSCADCHMSPKALGLGSGHYDVKANFPDGGGPDFEPERIVDEEGKQIQATNHYGARPFNKEEQQRISRVGTCIACHAEEGGVKLGGNAPTDELHQAAIRKMTKK
ncbi:MAG: multiheme c-type cytochrome [Pseudomonadota bacterium]